MTSERCQRARVPPELLASFRAVLETIERARSETHHHKEHRIILYRLTSNAPDARTRAAVEQPYTVDEVAVLGGSSAICDGIRHWADLGADSVVLCPLADETNPTEFVRFVAEEVMPRVD